MFWIRLLLPEAGPQSFATIVNAQLAQQIHEQTHRPYGVVMIDFAGTTDGQTIIKSLINSNFQK